MDKRLDGTEQYGERIGTSKLTSEMVQEMRKRHSAGGVLQTQLAKDYGISPSQVGHIVNREQWKHVP